MFFCRPYFTYWVTFVQTLIFIVSVAVYGIAPIGVSETETKQIVSYKMLFDDRSIACALSKLKLHTIGCLI